MTLKEALALINARKGSDPTHVHRLVCGFEPLHLATLLQGRLLTRLSGDVELQCGVYGDLPGNLEAATDSNAIAAALVVEWSDIDPRLGMRSSGGWTEGARASILETAPERLARIEARLADLGVRMPVAVASPSLPLPPMGGTPAGQRSAFELELIGQVAGFLLRVSRLPGIRVVELPRPAEADVVLDSAMELGAGFPYTVPFSDALAASLAGVLWPSSPRKGLITDLDDTLWRGIVGEIGPDAVSWSQDSRTQTHGLYQQMLGHLASSGILVAICSKNELSTVQTALSRDDLFVNPEIFFPIHAGWGPKSESVARILDTWNIAADSVVFVDDSPMEIEEVRQAHPGITGLHFRGKDPRAVWELLHTLRELFGRPTLGEEDRLRGASIRAGAAIRELAVEGATDPEEFLRGLDGSVTIARRVAHHDMRPFELINKTNQFNLNGHRIGEGEWRRGLEDPDGIVLVVSYGDKFGPLGKIAALKGTRRDGAAYVSHWVMSCRAFSRRIEHHTLDGLFRLNGISEIVLDYQETERNRPLQEFLSALGVTTDAGGGVRLTRDEFLSRAFALPHAVVDLNDETAE